MRVKRDAWRGFVFAVYAMLTAAVAFVVIFAYRYVDFYLKEEMGGYLLSNEALALLGAGLCVLGVWLLRRAGVARVERILARAGWRLIAGMTLLTLVMQIMVCYHAHYTTRWDAQSVVDSAYAFARGEYEYFFTEYFSRCQNNITLMALYGYILKAVMAVTHTEPGLERFMVLLIIMQSVISVSVGVMVWRLTRDLLSDRVKTPYMGAATAWLLYFVLIGCSPWFLIPYSDSTALWIPTLFMLIYMRKGSHRSAWEGFALGVLGGFAFCLKPQTMIPLIAIVMNEGARAVYGKKWRKPLVYLCMLAVGAVLMVGPVKNMIVNSIEVELNQNHKLGLVHYFRMGLNEERTGMWEGRDDELMEFETNEERNAYELQMAIDRIRAFGVKGLARHSVKKCLANFSDGSFGAGTKTYRSLSEEKSPVLTPLIRNLFFGEGKYFRVLHTVHQGAWMLVLMLCAAGVLVCRKLIEDEEEGICVMMLSTVGIICFNMLFEAGPRYVFVMVPVMIVLAVYTLGALAEKGVLLAKRHGNGAENRYAG